MEKSIKLVHPLTLLGKCVTILDLCSILSLFIYIPALKLDLFFVKDTLCTGIWNNKYFKMDILRQFKLCTCKLAWSPKYRDTRALVIGPSRELIRMKLQKNYHHQGKIVGLRSSLDHIKSSTNHTFSSMKCWFHADTLVCGALQHICQELG